MAFLGGDGVRYSPILSGTSKFNNSMCRVLSILFSAAPDSSAKYFLVMVNERPPIPLPARYLVPGTF